MSVTSLSSVIGAVPMLPKEREHLTPYDILVYNDKTGAILYQEQHAFFATLGDAENYARYHASQNATVEEVMQASIVCRPFLP